MKKEIIKNVAILSLVIISIILGIYGYRKYQEIKYYVAKLEATNKTNGKYQAVYEDGEIESIKAENKALYDSIKSFKNEINYLAQFKYKKDYSSGIVYTQPLDSLSSIDNLEIKTYEYANESNDSINYKLQIGSTTEPIWYNVDISINDKLTLVNRNVNGFNQVTIGSENGAIIDDVTIFNKKDKKTFWSRFTVGPQVTAGYDVVNNKMGVMVGFGGTFSLK